MEEDWWVIASGEVRGPFDSRTLRTLAATGDLRPTDRIRRRADSNWIEAAKVQGLVFGGRERLDPTPTTGSARSTSDVATPTTRSRESSGAAHERDPYPAITICSRACKVVGILAVVGGLVSALNSKDGFGFLAAAGAVFCGIQVIATSELLKLLVDMRMDMQAMAKCMRSVEEILTRRPSE